MSVEKYLYLTAYEILLNMIPSSITEQDLEQYFVGDSSNPQNLKDVYISFAIYNYIIKLLCNQAVL